MQTHIYTYNHTHILFLRVWWPLHMCVWVFPRQCSLHTTSPSTGVKRRYTGWDECESVGEERREAGLVPTGLTHGSALTTKTPAPGHGTPVGGADTCTNTHGHKYIQQQHVCAHTIYHTCINNIQYQDIYVLCLPFNLWLDSIKKRFKSTNKETMLPKQTYFWSSKRKCIQIHVLHVVLILILLNVFALWEPSFTFWLFKYVLLLPRPPHPHPHTQYKCVTHLSHWNAPSVFYDRENIMMFCALGHELSGSRWRTWTSKSIEARSPMEKTGAYDAVSQAI